MNLERFLEGSIDCKQDGNVNQYDFFETVFYTLENVTRIYEFDKQQEERWEARWTSRVDS